MTSSSSSLLSSSTSSMEAAGQQGEPPAGVSPDEEALGEDKRPLRLVGSLFFALPNGGAVLYNLEGFADGPEPASVVELETPAKTTLTFTVPVSNWLRSSQRCVPSCCIRRLAIFGVHARKEGVSPSFCLLHRAFVRGARVHRLREGFKHRPPLMIHVSNQVHNANGARRRGVLLDDAIRGEDDRGIFLKSSATITPSFAVLGTHPPTLLAVSYTKPKCSDGCLEFLIPGQT